MADCNPLLTGIDLMCADAGGGIQTIYLAKYVSPTDIAYTKDATEVITAMTNSVNAFYEYKQASEIATFEDNGSTTDANAPASFENTIVLTFTKMTPETRVELKNLAKGFFRAIVADNNGNFKYIPGPLRMTTSTSSLGKAIADGQPWTITLVSRSIEPSSFIDDQVVADSLNGASIAAPADFYVSALAATTATLNWTAVSGATGYVVERSVDALFTVPIPQYTGALLTANVTGLTTVTQYWFRIRATQTGITTTTYNYLSLKTE